MINENVNHCSITNWKYFFFPDGFGKFTVEVIDSTKDYAEFMKEIFDFPSIKGLLSGSATGKPFRVLFDAMHGGNICFYLFLLD